MMNPATQLFMLTPMSEWHPDERKDKDKTLLTHILECMVEGEMESLSWEDILHCRPAIYSPEEMKSLCFEVWDYDLAVINDILGNVDIDWQAAAEERLKFMILECEKLEDDAITELAKMEARNAEEWDDFKKRIDRHFANPCPLSIAQVKQSVDYHSSRIKMHTKYINYMKGKLENTESK